MRITLPTVALLALAAPAHAGDVSGTLGPKAPLRAVVWLEGVPAAAWTLPKDQPKISQRGARFRPDFLVVVAGQHVAIPNDDLITHNVFSMSPAKKFDLGHYGQGESRSVQFDKPGVIDIFCNIHENMHALLVVAPSTFYAMAGPDGRFTIPGVPPGTYKLVAYSPDSGTASASVTVGATGGASARLQLERK